MYWLSGLQTVKEHIFQFFYPLAGPDKRKNCKIQLNSITITFVAKLFWPEVLLKSRK